MFEIWTTDAELREVLSELDLDLEYRFRCVQFQNIEHRWSEWFFERCRVSGRPQTILLGSTQGTLNGNLGNVP